jgi:hypothetical protein
MSDYILKLWMVSDTARHCSESAGRVGKFVVLIDVLCTISTKHSTRRKLEKVYQQEVTENLASHLLLNDSIIDKGEPHPWI